MTPLIIKSKLSNAYNSCPKYNIELNNKTFADPSMIRVLVALMNQHAAIGGAASHWGGPSAYAEIFSVLHEKFFNTKNWSEDYNFINDTGHAENAIYATRALYSFDNMELSTLKGFRSIESKLTGHGESHVNPEGVFISNGPLGSGLPQAQGLSIGDKLKNNDRITICTMSDGAAMEGEAKESLSAIPGLSKKGKMNPFILIISDNNTKLSGRIDEDSFSMSPSFNSLEKLGWNSIHVEQGNNLKSVSEGLESALLLLQEHPKKPIALICKTVKGFGIKSTEEAKSGGHGYPLKAYDPNLKNFINELTGDNTPEEFLTWCDQILNSKPTSSESKNSIPTEKVQVGIAKALIEKAKEGYPIYSISSDLAGSTGLASFQKEFPERSLDIGIAESNMISTAIGLSKSGFIPVVDTFCQFAITKGNLPLIMSSLSQGPVIGIFSHTGFQDAADGASHQSTTYINAIASIPNTDVVVLSSSRDAYEYLSSAITNFKTDIENEKTPNSTIFFLGRENYTHEISEDLTYNYKSSQIIKEGKDIAIFSCGPLIYEALGAAKLLEERGIKATVINQHFVNKFNDQQLKDILAKNNNKLITLEDHQVMGGMGSLLIHHMKQLNLSFNSLSLGIDGKFGQSAYKSIHLYQKHGLDGQSVADRAEQFLK